MWKACKADQERYKKEYKKTKCDLGELVNRIRSSPLQYLKLNPPDALTVRMVFDTSRIIAEESRKKNSEKNRRENKKNYITPLLAAAIDCEPKYLVNLLQMKLLIGYAEPTLLAALGQAGVYHTTEHPESATLKEASQIVKQVYSILPYYDKIVFALLQHGVLKLPETCTLGVLVGPMLPKATKGVSEVVTRFRDLKFTYKYKYDDGMRRIHHMENGLVEVYSRRVEQITEKFPDVVATVSRLKKSYVSSFILDCELVAYDRVKHQIISRRDHMTMSDKKEDDCIFAFNLLYLNGKVLLKENLIIRREHLYASFEEESGVFSLQQKQHHLM